MAEMFTLKSAGGADFAVEDNSGTAQIALAGTAVTSTAAELNQLDGNILNTLATEAGSGISGIAESYATSVTKVGGVYKTEILIDLTGLNSSAAADIIGDDGVANCHIGQITAARNGSIIAGLVTCLEAPATGEPDIDLYSAVEATGTEDAAITALDETALLAAAADWTIATQKALTAFPAADEYLYLVGSGGGTDATYTAGKFLIQLWGK